MRHVYLKILVGDIEEITVYGTRKRAKDALRKDMEKILNDEQLAFSEEEKQNHRKVFNKTSSFALPYLPGYEHNDNAYIQCGEIRVEAVY